MKLKKNSICLLIVSLLVNFMFYFNFAYAKENTPILQIMSKPLLEYKNEDTISFTVTSPNYGGKVEYRILLYNGTTKTTTNLWDTPASGYYYRGWQPAGNYEFYIHWPVSQLEPGAYSMTVLVRRAGSSVSYDSYVDTNSFFVKDDGDFGIRTEMAYQSTSNAVSSDFPRWSDTIDSYIVYNNNKTISVIQAQMENVTIESYNNDFKLISKNSIKNELPLFGGFFSGEQYNYIAFGQSNMEEDNHKEVLRIVRYDKDFNRIDDVSINGGDSYTTVPFDAGCGRMAENGNILVFHTSRLRYKTEDGKHHQSQLTLIVDTSSMKVMNNLGQFQRNHVSHSFDQYVQFDGNSHVLIDHGDAYPRSVVLSKENDSNYTKVDLFKIPGSIGANCTGVSVGGFEISSESYIVALNSIDHSFVSKYTSFEMVGLNIDQRDIIICTLPKNNIESSEVKQITLAKYVGSGKIASIPQLVKVSEEKLMVLWQEFDITNRKQGNLKYIFIDKNGNATTEIYSLKNYKLSTCKPVIIENAVVWYINEGSFRTFYSIPLN